jgi:hypothetical protein
MTSTSISSWGTYIRKQDPNINFNSNAFIVAGWGGADSLRDIGFLAWDISTITKNSKVQSAVITFRVAAYTAAKPVTIARILRQDMEPSEATYNIYKTGSAWTISGGDGNGTDYTDANQVTYTATFNGEFISLDITDMLQDSVNSTDSSLILKFWNAADFELSDRDTINDQGSGTVAFRPTMTAIWRTPLQEACGLKVKNIGSRTVDNSTLTRTVKKAGSRTVSNKECDGS